MIRKREHKSDTENEHIRELSIDGIFICGYYYYPLKNTCYFNSYKLTEPLVISMLEAQRQYDHYYFQDKRALKKNIKYYYSK